MPDLAKLVISCDSTQIVDGDKKMGQLASTTERAEAGLTKMNRVLAGLGVAAGIGLLARQAYNTNVEFERLNTSLVTVTKSQDRANQVFDELTSFAARTPFQLSEVTSAYIMMRARGLDPTMDTMTSLGNLASGMGRSFQDTIGAVGSLAAGEIEPMKQLGFSVMTIGDQVRISSGGVSESVQRNAYDISKAVARISDVKFAGGMERQINTLGGAFSNLQDQVDNTLYKMGQRGLNANLVQGMQDVTRAINEATPAMADFTAGAVNGSVEAVKWLADHKSAVLALGAAYVAVKVGQGVGGIQQGFSTGEGGGIGAKAKGVTDYIQALRLARAEDLAYAEDEVRTARARVDSLNRQNFVAVRNAQQQATVDFEAIAMTRAKQAAQDGYTAALAKQTIVQRANTAGAMAGSLASKGFGAVVSALGGPLGATAALLTTVAIVGPMAWEASKSSAQKASEEADKYLVRLREEVALLDRKNELQGQGRTGEAGLDDPTIKALQAKEKYYGEIQVALQAARERVRKSGGVDQNELMGEQQLLEKLRLISKEYKEIATSAQRVRDDRNQKSAAATAASKADAETAAANAKREMAEQKKAQEQAKQVEDRKKAIKDLREEIETFGMAKEAVERYKMAKLGLANTKEFQELQAMKAIRRQDIADADLEIEKLEAKRRTTQVAFEENQEYLQAEADAFESARETVNPLVREIEQLGYAYEALAFSRGKDGGISDQQFAEGEARLVRSMQNVRLEHLRLKAESGNTWAIIGNSITQQAGRASDAMVNWMNNTDGLGRSWKSLGDTVRNVLADMIVQMQRAYVQQQLMQPLMQWAGLALGSLGPASSTSSLGSQGLPSTFLGTGTGGGYSFANSMPSGGFAVPQSTGKVQSQIIINIASDGTSTTKNNGTAMAQEMQRSVEPMVLQVIDKHMRPGGRLNPTRGGGMV